jgi:DNA polymerase-4
MLNQSYGFDIRPRQFFIDMNSFFTSCEQQECPEHRNKPTIVVPMNADTTCALAASYEAKAYGIKTGTNVKVARTMCPHLHIVEARPRIYLQYNARIQEILNDHFATVRALSIDEMACRVPHIYTTTESERSAACRVKAQMRSELGPYMRCSIGIAPNVFLAKVASECMKPDGLTIWNETNLPDALYPLPIQALPGIGKGVKVRLARHAIHTTHELCKASPGELRRAWGGVVGEQWWYMLRGSRHLDYAPSHQAGDTRKSVSHSNILAPHHRSSAAATRILLELSEKALKRIRTYEQAALSVSLSISFRRTRGAISEEPPPFDDEQFTWHKAARLHAHANDDLTWLHVLRPLVNTVPNFGSLAYPMAVAIAYSELADVKDVNLSLFDETVERQRLAATIDQLNTKYKGAIALGTLSKNRQVPLRIPFGSPEQPTVHPY